MRKYSYSIIFRKRNAKKEWIKRSFDEELVFYCSVERGKCFIEYIPAENDWIPIEADGYFYINCLWVSGSMKVIYITDKESANCNDF